MKGRRPDRNGIARTDVRRPARSRRARRFVLTIAALLTVVHATAGVRAQSAVRPRVPAAAEVDALYSDVEALYIDLHQHPELAFQEIATAAKLAERARAAGFDVTTGIAG